MRTLLLLWACLTTASAASLKLTVLDPTGARVPAASISLELEGSNSALALRSAPDGTASAPNLSPGKYRLRIEAARFDTHQQSLDITSDQTLEVRLTLSSLKSETTVRGKASGGNQDPVYRQTRDLAIAEAFSVENLTITRDAATITLKRGRLAFGPPILGRVTTAVFSGEAEFQLTPTFILDKQHLTRVIEKDNIHDTFSQALFSFTDKTYDEIKAAAKPAPKDPKDDKLLADLRRELRHTLERPRTTGEFTLFSGDKDNLDAEQLVELLNPARPGAFTAHILGKDFPHLRFILSPRGALPDMPSPEEVAVIASDPSEKRDGILYLSHTQAEIQKGLYDAHEDKRIAATLNYRIETVLGGNDKLNALAEVEFVPRTEGDRVIRFGLLPTLRVSRVSLNGNDIHYIQEDRREDAGFYVVFPEPLKARRKYKILIEYAGDKVVKNAGGGNFFVSARTSWYPSLNSFADRANYDLTFRFPRRFTLVSIGKKMSEQREGELTVSRWVTETPVAVAGFNYGNFKKQETKDTSTEYQVEGYATSELPDYLRNVPDSASMTPSRLINQAIVETQNSIRLFSHWFGPSLYNRIAITQQPEMNYGQSWPGLVYLPLSAFLDSTQRWQMLGLSSRFTEFIQEVTPHEVAHQWWGHIVGWATYHDQWLSEGFADFSSSLYLQATKPAQFNKFWERHRDTILDRNEFGKRANDAGPIWMGFRLNSAKFPGAYNRIVYPKGAYVLHMLRSLMYDTKTGDEPFINMMREFVQSHANRGASTESFKATVEKHMRPAMNLGGDNTLNWFFRQWVYGTDIPKYDFTVKIEPGSSPNTSKISGTLTQSKVPDTFLMAVPLYFDLDGKIAQAARINISGNKTVPFSFETAAKPKRVLINAQMDVLSEK